jgi:C-terminal peptidase prc
MSIKKLFIALLLSMTLLSSSVVPAMAQIHITIPSAEESQDLSEYQLGQITGFLEQYSIVQKCLRRKQENTDITSSVAICTILQVFDQDNSQIKHWEKAKKLGLIAQDAERNATITGFEYLSLLFETAGVTISPLSESAYEKNFRTLRLRLKQDEAKTLATALETGLIMHPVSSEEAAELKIKLSKEALKTEQALAFLYQVATSQHQETTIINLSPAYSSESLPLEDILKQIFTMIKTQSYFNENFDEKKAMEAAIKAAVKTLEDDKYIEYYTSEEFNSFSEGLNGNLEGIGAYIEEQEGKLIIVSPIEGSPAAKAGIHPGDIITHINGESTEGMILQKAVEKIRGPQGTTVKLNISRNGSTLEFTITRNKITIPAISVTNKENIEIIKLVQFGGTSALEMKQELDTIAKKNPQGIIIDLRNNPGGFLNEVVTIVDYFLPKDKPVVYLQDKYQRTSMDTTLDPIVQDMPIAILINKGSASASEILAGVLQSYGIAKIYGETSFGKGTVQNIMSLQSEDQSGLSAFKFTTAEYLIANPNGEPKSIDGIGVKPDSNPGEEPLLDNRETPEDEALNAVISDMKMKTRR